MSDTIEQRIEKIRGNTYIRYPRAEAVIAKLDDLMLTPPRHRMPNMLLVGDTNNGKTMIVQRFKNRHPPHVSMSGTGSSVPVLVVQAPPVPDEGRFYNAILNELYTPFRSTGRLDQRQVQVMNLLRLVGVKMLIIDEIHHILAGSMMKQRHFLNMLKYFGNELMIPIVGVGTRDAFNVIHSDPQLANRFEPAVLPKWQLDEEFLRLLASFESRLPFTTASNLATLPFATKLLALSEGTIGELASLIASASIHAVRNGRDCLTPEVIDECGYVTPSSRRRQAL